jgi:predicted acylesterase/phospholipase RssA
MGRSVGLVLSGGGARAFAHIGVVEELLASGVELDRVAGSSMGAFVGAQVAMGLEPGEIYANCEEEFIGRKPLSDYTVPSSHWCVAYGPRRWSSGALATG